jgi:hypothetical protein
VLEVELVAEPLSEPQDSALNAPRVSGLGAHVLGDDHRGRLDILLGVFVWLLRLGLRFRIRISHLPVGWIDFCSTLLLASFAFVVGLRVFGGSIGRWSFDGTTASASTASSRIVLVVFRFVSVSSR